MKTLRIFILTGWGCLIALSLQAQKTIPHNFQYKAEASRQGQWKALTQVGYSGTSSIRLYFEDVQLGPNSYLLLEGSDGAQQKLDAVALQNWSNSSAYFNGQNVKISLYQAVGEEVAIKLRELKVNDKEGSPKADQVITATAAQARTGANQDLPPWAAAVGRFTDGVKAMGTGWIAANGAIVTDVNYGTSESFEIGTGPFIDEYDIIEFNVPPSNLDGTVNHPAPEDQYPLNKDYFFWRRIEGQEKNSDFDWIGFIQIKPYEGIYRDEFVGGYTIVEALPNGTGKRPGERIGEYFQVLKHNSGWVMDGLEMELFHYAFNNLGVSNQTLQKTGIVLKDPNDWLKKVSNKDRFLVYDTPVPLPGFWNDYMEGGPIVYPGSNIVVGIHSEGDNFSEHPSAGTGFLDQEFREHLSDFFSSDYTYVDPGTVLDEANGEIDKPYANVWAGTQFVADNGTVNIVRGHYNENLTVDRPMKLIAPVGTVVIGAAGTANSRVMQPSVPAALYGDNPSSAFAEEEDVQIEQSSLQSYPNPFTEQTELHYSLSEEAPVTVKVFNILGIEINTLVEEEQTEGEKSVVWNGLDHRGKAVERGIYIIQVQTGDEYAATRVIKK